MFGFFRHGWRSIFQQNRIICPPWFRHGGGNGVERTDFRLKYSTVSLRILRNFSTNLSLNQSTHERLKSYGILKPFRGCRSGKKVKSSQQTRI